uniref:Piezo non-specific cation channel R-Ras-binding domain-containing protein n=1 Tax=Romanomermis culicivorax TaxID=13658 RepID=A0A915KAT0_ROMCU
LAHIAITKDLNLKETVSAAEKADERRTQSDTEMVGQATSTTISTKTADTPTASRRKSKSTSEFERMTNVDASSLSKVTHDAKSADRKPDSFTVSVLKFLRYACVSVPDHCAFWFNKWSRDYRYVAHVLKKEKRVLKENLSHAQQQGTINNVKKVRETIFSGEFGQRIHLVKSESEIDTVEKEVHDFWLQHNVFVRFFISLFYLLLSHTELLCYIMVILDQMKNASIISLPLPFLIFFWGTLRSPRPPQFFWVTVITYAMFMIVVKFIAQFEFGGSAIPINAPLDARRIIGIERMSYYASWDVALLMVLFFHRYVLKTLGLWKDADCGQDNLSKASTEQPDVAKSEEPVAIEDISVFEKEIPKTADSIELQELAQEAGTSSNAAVKCDDANVQSGVDDVKKYRKSCCTRCIDFYKRLLSPTFRYIMDLYAYMFLCDVICFLILTFGYSSFGVAAGKSDNGAENADVVANIKSNKVPLGFVIMLVSLMILIIIDRGIYLRKNIVARLVFQHLLVLLVHVWIFFALPAITDRSIQFAAQLWYFVKCVYFLLSAWQIRNGYPSRIFGNLLTKKYNLLNYSLFTGFMAAPFLFELRTLIDWIWTDTCMPLFDFFTMENIYSVIYRIKCMRKMEKDYPVPKGIAKGAVVKYGMGCPILILVILLVWLPLLLFALVNSIGVRSLPIQAKMIVSIEGYPPLYTMDVQKSSLQPMSQPEFDGLSTDKFEKDKLARTFLRDYTAGDTLKVAFRSSSNTKWDISTPSLDALEEDLKNPVEMSIEFEFVRPRQNAAKEPIRQTTKYKHVLNRDARSDFIKILKNKSKANSSDGVSVLRLYSPYVEIPPMGEIQPVKVLLYALTNESGPAENAYYGLDFALIGNDVAGYYWRIRSTNQTEFDIYNHIMMTAFVDRMFPSAFDSITSGGIIGVYIVVVLAAGNVLRNLVVNKALDIIIAEMPNVDRILQLCMDIFLVREAKDFLLELDLFAKLLFLFRSPETLIKWTRSKRD